VADKMKKWQIKYSKWQIKYSKWQITQKALIKVAKKLLLNKDPVRKNISFS